MLLLSFNFYYSALRTCERDACPYSNFLRNVPHPWCTKASVQLGNAGHALAAGKWEISCPTQAQQLQQLV